MGLPTRWRTMITSYKKNEIFIDEQLKGPYSYWHHKHTFKEINGQVKMIDEIHYALPIQILRELVHPLIIKPQLKKIFRDNKARKKNRLTAKKKSRFFFLATGSSGKNN